MNEIFKKEKKKEAWEGKGRAAGSEFRGEEDGRGPKEAPAWHLMPWCLSHLGRGDEQGCPMLTTPVSPYKGSEARNRSERRDDGAGGCPWSSPAPALLGGDEGSCRPALPLPPS